MRTQHIILTITSILLAAAITPDSAGADFTQGDFYIMTHAWPVLGAALARIDPVTGVTQVLWEVDDLPLNAQLTYDPWRDRIVTMPDTNSDLFRLVDSTGTVTTMANPWTHGFTLATWAPTGDGRIYMVTNGLGYYGYLDAAGVGHDLFDTDGVTPFFFTYGATSLENLIYDKGTNSLFLVHYGAATEVTKVQLSKDGTHLAAPMVTVTFDAFPPTADEPMGLSAGPNGTLFIKIDTNSNADGLRMFTVDPVTLQFAPYAYIGHPFVGGNTAGTYNSTYDFAIALDSFNDVIRSYVESGAVQEGVIFATGVSRGGSGEQTRIITIGDTINVPASPADLNGDGCADSKDLTILLGAWCSAVNDPNPPSPPCENCTQANLDDADIAGAGGGPPDGCVDSSDLLELLGDWCSVAGGNPCGTCQ